MSVNKNDIDELLHRWNALRKQSSVIRSKEKKYREIISRLMNEANKDEISGSRWAAMRKHRKARKLNKKMLPKEIWEKYSEEKTYTVFVLQSLIDNDD